MRFPAKNLYFPLPQQSMRTTSHYPERLYGRTYADVITPPPPQKNNNEQKRRQLNFPELIPTPIVPKLDKELLLF